MFGMYGMYVCICNQEIKMWDRYQTDSNTQHTPHPLAQEQTDNCPYAGDPTPPGYGTKWGGTWEERGMEGNDLGFQRAARQTVELRSANPCYRAGEGSCNTTTLPGMLDVVNGSTPDPSTTNLQPATGCR